MAIFLDIDTAGLNPEKHSILIVRIWNTETNEKKQLHCFDTSKTYDEKTLEYLSYSKEEILSWDDISKVKEELQWLTGKPIVVYNATFVRGFLKAIGFDFKLVSMMDVAFFLKTIGILKGASQSLPSVYKELIKKGKAKTKIERLVEIHKAIETRMKDGTK